MNKLTKVGCSALCGSLAAISSASAGTLTATGSAHLTWVSLEGTNGSNGNPIGMASAVTFNGSGDLGWDGWDFNLAIADNDKGVYSAATITINMGGFGSLEFDGGNSGNGLAAYDNVMPTAWEEAHGAGLSGGVKTVMGAGASANVMYTLPTFWGTTIALTHAHDYGTTDTADKATGATEDDYDDATDITVKINPTMGTEILSGLNLYLGAGQVKTFGQSTVEEDVYEGTGAVTYSLGPVSLGAQWSGIYTGQENADDWNYYKSHGFGVAFNVNDDLSVSYGEYQTRKAGYDEGDGRALKIPEENLRVVEVTSWQAAYTMGGASMRIATVTADNANFDNTTDVTATVLSLGLAF
jgi:hypothetical protein